LFAKLNCLKDFSEKVKGESRKVKVKSRQKTKVYPVELSEAIQ